MFNKLCNKGHCTCYWDRWRDADWRHCCIEHDRDITERRVPTTIHADVKLIRCMWKQSRLATIPVAILVWPVTFWAWIWYNWLKVIPRDWIHKMRNKK